MGRIASDNPNKSDYKIEAFNCILNIFFHQRKKGEILYPESMFSLIFFKSRALESDVAHAREHLNWLYFLLFYDKSDICAQRSMVGFNKTRCVGRVRIINQT